MPPFLNKSADAPLVKQKVKVRPRLKSDAANNAHEHEADRVADNLRQAKNSSQVNSKQMHGEASGARLPEPTRELMEEELGADFSGVRIHSDSSANALANSFGANALTKGEDIYFNSDRYDPASEEGRGLIAHELTHVTQQRGQAAGQVQFDLMETLPTALGYFEIEMERRSIMQVGMEGHIRFFPDPSGPYSAQIGLIQVVNMADVSGRTNHSPGDPVRWSRIGTGAEAGRQDLMTTGTDGAPQGWFVDSQIAAHSRGSDVGPNYIEHWSAPQNFFGWLRSPTDLHETSLYDLPSASFEADFEFETVAKATDTQNIYGAIEWGFQIRAIIPGSRVLTVRNEYARVSDTASATFNEALERFRGYFTHEPIVLYFDTDVDTPIAGEEAKITGVLDYLRRYPDVRINIDGYADERGTVEHNSDLALRRADNVQALAISLGVDASRINFTVGHGETTAFAPGAALNAGTWRANRRVVMSFERTASTPIVMP
ncbi:MAG: hypothetical protein QOH63_2960 [Acidobacteriota bacterium]|nr:hypothetical protein [Acidobacteriota bacterium]